MTLRVDTVCFLLTWLTNGLGTVFVPLFAFAAARLQNSANRFAESYYGVPGQEQQQYGQQQYGQQQYGQQQQYSAQTNAMSYYLDQSYAQGYGQNARNNYPVAYQSAYSNQGYSSSNAQQSTYYHQGSGNTKSSQPYYGKWYNSHGAKRYGFKQWADDDDYIKYPSFQRDNCGLFGCAYDDDIVWTEVSEVQNPSPTWFDYVFAGPDGVIIESGVSKPRINTLIVVYACLVPVLLGIILYGYINARSHNVQRVAALAPVLWCSAVVTVVLSFVIVNVPGVVAVDRYSVAENGWYGQVGVLIFLTCVLWTIFAAIFGVLLSCGSFNYEEHRRDMEHKKQHNMEKFNEDFPSEDGRTVAASEYDLEDGGDVPPRVRRPWPLWKRTTSPKPSDSDGLVKPRALSGVSFVEGVENPNVPKKSPGVIKKTVSAMKKTFGKGTKQDASMMGDYVAAVDEEAPKDYQPPSTPGYDPVIMARSPSTVARSVAADAQVEDVSEPTSSLISDAKIPVQSSTSYSATPTSSGVEGKPASRRSPAAKSAGQGPARSVTMPAKQSTKADSKADAMKRAATTAPARDLLDEDGSIPAVTSGDPSMASFKSTDYATDVTLENLRSESPDVDYEAADGGVQEARNFLKTNRGGKPARDDDDQVDAPGGGESVCSDSSSAILQRARAQYKAAKMKDLCDEDVLVAVTRAERSLHSASLLGRARASSNSQVVSPPAQRDSEDPPALGQRASSVPKGRRGIVTRAAITRAVTAHPSGTQRQSEDDYVVDKSPSSISFDNTYDDEEVVQSMSSGSNRIPQNRSQYASRIGRPQL